MEVMELAFIVEEINKPKLTIFVAEKRNLQSITHTPYENKEYSCSFTVPIGLKELNSETLSRFLEEANKAIVEQQKKDGVKPLRSD